MTPLSARAAHRLNVLWLQSGGCGGCTMSLLCSRTGDVLDTLREAGVDLLWHPALSEESGPEALEVLRACAEGRTRVDVLCLEGAVLRGPKGTGRFHTLAGTGESMMSWVSQLAARAEHVVAIGTCAAYGGMTSAGDNPTDACGLQYEGETPGGLLGAGWRDADGLPVVNVAGCPPHPEWMVETLAALAAGAFGAADLDPLGRPALVHQRARTPRLPSQRVLRVQGERRQAVRPGLPDGEHGLQGDAGARRLQHPPLERVGLVPARRLRLHRLHRSLVRGAGPCLRGDPQDSRGSRWRCRSTCRRPGSWPWRRSPSRPRLGGFARTPPPTMWCSRRASASRGGNEARRHRAVQPGGGRPRGRPRHRGRGGPLRPGHLAALSWLRADPAREEAARRARHRAAGVRHLLGGAVGRGGAGAGRRQRRAQPRERAARHRPRAGDGEPGRPPDALLPVLHARLRPARLRAAPLARRRRGALPGDARYRRRRGALGARPAARADGTARREVAAHARAPARRHVTVGAAAGEDPADDGAAPLPGLPRADALRGGPRGVRRADGVAALDAWREARPTGAGDARAFLEAAADLDLERFGRASDIFLSAGSYGPGGGALARARSVRRRAPALRRGLHPGRREPRLDGERRATPPGAGRHPARSGQGGGVHVVQGAAARRAGGGGGRAGAAGRRRPPAGARPRRTRRRERAVARGGAPPRAGTGAAGDGALGGSARAGRALLCRGRAARRDERGWAGGGGPRHARALAGGPRRGDPRLPESSRRPPGTSPRDAEGRPGPLEQALVGLPGGEGEAAVLVQHVVRSFDPCMVCTVH